MTKYLEEILRELNCFLELKGQPLVDTDRLVFSIDSNINYSAEGCSIPKSKLIELDQFDVAIAPLFVDGPSWIHANLLYTDDRRPLITIKFGTYIGTSNSSINVSYETKIVKILNGD